MPHKEPPVEHQFKKGQSGNLKGKPKGTLNMTTLIREYLESFDEKKGKYVKDIVKEAFVKRSVAKSDVLMKELMDRIDGKVPQENRLTGKDGQPLINEEHKKTAKEAIGSYLGK